MAKGEPKGTASGGAGDEEPRDWDFRLDRSGLTVAAGRYMQLRMSLGLLLLVAAVVTGWSSVQVDWPFLM